MLKYLALSQTTIPSWKNLVSKTFIIFAVGCVLTLSYVSDTNAQNSKAAQNLNHLSDEKKFDLLKGAQELIWTCENNVTVKTSNIGTNYLVLFNKKLFTMTGIEALNGVSHFTDMGSRFDWFIIPGKAMLFDSKIGQRVLDYCQTAEMKHVKVPESNLMK